MAAPLETLKKAAKAMNPFGGNAKPPEVQPPVDKKKIREQADKIEKDLDKEKVAR